jgi:hypothetical protein
MALYACKDGVLEYVATSNTSDQINSKMLQKPSHTYPKCMYSEPLKYFQVYLCLCVPTYPKRKELHDTQVYFGGCFQGREMKDDARGEQLTNFLALIAPLRWRIIGGVFHISITREGNLHSSLRSFVHTRK